MTEQDLTTVTLWRDGDEHRARLTRLDAPVHGFGPADSPGELLEDVGRYLDELEARRLELEQRAQDGAPTTPPSPEEAAALEDVARVVEVLEDHAGDALRTDRLEALTGIDVVRLAAALGQARRDGVVQVVPFGDRTFWTLAR